MGNHCVYTVCRECGEEYCLRCEFGICPKCGTPWNAKPRMMTVYDYMGKPHEMTVTEIYQETLELGKRDKIDLVNRILASIKDTDKPTPEQDDNVPAMPVYEGLTVFAEIYRAKKGVTYTTGKFSNADYKNMKELLWKIEERIVEGGTVIVNDALRIGNLKMFLQAVCSMKNQWYFENRFNPYGLNNDFEKIYSNLKNNSDHARRKAAFDNL
jgi:hypothetical protein